MANVYDAANFFIDYINRTPEDKITNLKLNKLLYYAQGCYLSRYHRPLFKDTIEAWQFGPVIPAVYEKYKVCGHDPIPSTDSVLSNRVFTENELETLTDVMREYGKYTASALVTLTHMPDTPWSIAQDKGSVHISEKSMEKYFTDHPVPTVDDILAQIPGITSLPVEWYDESEDSEWETD